MLDTVIQRLCITGRMPKRSPDVQSGDMSQLASMIAGETMIVRILRTILIPATNVLSIFWISAFWVDSLISGGHGQGQPSAHFAYDIFHPTSAMRVTFPSLLIVWCTDNQKNPPTATRVRRDDVSNFLNIDWLDHNCYFFANSTL